MQTISTNTIGSGIRVSVPNLDTVLVLQSVLVRSTNSIGIASTGTGHKATIQGDVIGFTAGIGFGTTVNRLCCTNPVRDSSRESSVVAVRYEQTHTPRLQDQELARL